MIRSRAGAIAASIGAGLLIAMALPPWGWWPLAPVGLAVVSRLIAGASVGERFVRGATVALAWFAVSVVWMWDFSPPGYAVVLLLWSAMLGATLAATPNTRFRWLALPAVMVLFEWIRWSWPFEGVPVSTLAMTHADAPLNHTVRVAGPLLLVALVVMGGVVLDAILDRSPMVAMVGVAVIALAAGIASIAPRGEVVDTLDIAIVQGGGPQRTRAIDTDAREVFERHLAASRLVETPVDLVLWPENVVDVPGRLVDSPSFDELAELAVELDAILIPGITEDVSGDAFTNASVVFSPDGAIVARYDKVRRVPFGEFVPLRSVIEPFAPAALPARDALKGREPAVLETDIGTFGIVISWEVFFDDRVAEGVEEGGQLVLNPTNGSSYWLTIVQSQQIASSRLRALETGRWVLQAAPTGFSAIVTPDAEVIDRTGVSEQRVVQGTVELREGLTWAVRLGRSPMVALAIVMLGLAWLLDNRPRAATDPNRARVSQVTSERSRQERSRG